MMTRDTSARETILASVRRAVAEHDAEPLQPLPAAARFEPRRPAALEEEITRMLVEVQRVSGHGKRVRGQEQFSAALGELIRTEGIATASFSAHPLLTRYDIGAMLKEFGITVIPADGDGRALADCDLGITVADAALPETGTVLLRTTQGQPDALSLLPRVHLALVAPEAFLADLHQAFALAREDRHLELVTGCSRTADIEKVLTLGVHGPKSYHFWVCQ